MRTSRSSRSPVVAIAVLLALTACGTRAPDTLRQQAARAALNGGGTGTGTGGTGGTDSSIGGSTTAGTTTGGTTTGGTTTAGTTGGASGGTTAGTTGTGGTGGTTSGGSTGSTTPAGGNGGATDVGVTATSLDIGNVSDISGPRPGLFQGAVVGTQAYLAKINSEGGVFGRKLNLKIGDSQLDCGQNKAKTEGLVPKVFAFVGSFSLYDDCGSESLKAHAEIPDVHNALGQKSQALPNNFSIAPLGPGWRTGPLAYYAKKYGDSWKHIGAIYAGVGTGPKIWENTVAAINNSGGAVDRAESYGATDTDFTGAVVRMQSAGVKMIFVNTTDGPTTARLVHAVKSQNLTWPITFGATAYAPDFLSNISSGEAEGTVNDQQFAMFFNPDEGTRIPEVAEFQKWMKVVGKKQPMDIFAAYGWASAELFVDALKKAGAKATRKSLLAVLQSTHSFNANGMFAQADPASKKPATCWILTVVKGGKFQRVDSPASAFRCDGTYFRNGG
jgi:ABC-type branched-subunit amino acid transport system substrate-binding protein